MIRAISFIHTTASRTRPTGIARVNIDHFHPVSLGFVSHERTQLVERPAMQRVSLLARNGDSITDTLQIFEGNAALSAFRNFNQLLADTVVDITGKTLFFARQVFQKTFSRARTFGLELLAQTTVAVANIQQSFGTVDIPIAVYGNILHSQINAQETLYVKRVYDPVFDAPSPLPIPDIAESAGSGWDQLAPLIKSALLLIPGVRQNAPVNTRPTVRTATGGTQTVTDQGVIVTRNAQGKIISTSRTPAKIPTLTASGALVVNNGNGTYDVVTSNGQRQTRPYNAGASTGGVNQNVLMYGALAVAAFFVLGKK